MITSSTTVSSSPVAAAAAFSSPLDSPSISSKKKAAAQRLLPYFQRNLVQNRVLTPGRIHSYIKPSYVHRAAVNKKAIDINHKDMSAFSILLCRKVTDLMGDRKNWGKVIRVDRLQGFLNWPWQNETEGYDYQKGSTYNITLDLALSVEISPDGKEMRLHFKTNNPKPLGKGSYKIAYEAEDIVVNMTRTRGNDGKWIFRRSKTCDTVHKISSLQLMGPDTLDPQRKIEEERLARGAQIHRVCYDRLLAAKRTGHAQDVYLSEPENDLGNGETRQLRYANLSQLRKSGTLSLTELLQYIRDVALTFQWLNAQGITHRDGGFANVNISRDGNDCKVACLADFDLAKVGFGFDPLNSKADTDRLDPCVVYGNFATPYLDLYATAILLCRAMIPHLSTNDKPVQPATGDKDAKLQAMLQSMCDFKFLRYLMVVSVEEQKTFDPDYCLRLYHGRYPELSLNGNQQKALVAFCRICYESAMLLKQFGNLSREQSDFKYPESVGHQETLDAMASLREKELFPGSGQLTYSFDNLIRAISEIQRNLA